MSKHWKPAKTTVALNAAGRPAPAVRPSRIRRDPVPINSNIPAQPQRPLNYRERDLFLGVVGIVIFAVAIGAATIMLAMFTVLHDDPAATAREVQFSQCYNAQGANCVLDGETIYIGGQRVQIAGIEAPKINDGACDAERSRGVDAAVQLAGLLNSGAVTVGPTTRDASGELVRRVEVQGTDVAARMIDRDVAHPTGSGLSWCH